MATIISNFANFFFKFLVDALNNGANADEFAKILALFIMVKLAVTFIGSYSYYVTDGYLFGGSKDLRLDVFQHLHKLDFSFHSNKQSGSLISVMKRGDGAFFAFTHEINREILATFIDFVFVLIVFSNLNLQLGLVVLVMVLLNIVLTYFLLKINIRTRDAFNTEEDAVSAIWVDNMINYETVKYFAKEKFEYNRLQRQFRTWLEKFKKYGDSFRLIDISTNLLAIAGSAIVILLALEMFNQQKLTVGDLVLLITFIGSFFPKLTNFVYRLREVAKQYVDLKRYVDILEIPVDVVEKPNATNLKDAKGLIEFKKVDFNYIGRTNVLKNFDLIIKQGESLALVGESGAGKSTLVKLLLRFYDVIGGAITIDNIDIRDLTKESLRTNIGVVPQEPVLFNETIAYNIGYGKDKSSLKEIKQAAEVANLAEFIETLPEKYKTKVGERGIKLSGGQKQRLAIARMFLANPPIIVFDEATSQLDSESEKLIQESFWRIAKNKTTIIIAHRLSTVMRSDRIIVIKNGQISEEGTHQELIEKEQGIYKHLWDLQKGGFLLKS